MVYKIIKKNKLKITLVFLLIFIFCGRVSYCQYVKQTTINADLSEKKLPNANADKHCGHVEAKLYVHNKYHKNYLLLTEKEDKIHTEKKAASVVYTLPVVVHVVSNGDAIGTGENISDAQVFSQIEKLNIDFRRLNADASSTPAVFASIAADVEIEFCLAQRKPDNSPTNGINRITTSQPNWVQSQIETTLKPTTIWNRELYINIWVVRLNASETVNGYAYLPYPPPDIDGIVIGHDAFGTLGTVASPSNEGRTCVHEMGHFFNLNHIWGDESACGADDGVSDTPLQLNNNTGCPSFPLIAGVGASCSSSSGAMFMNYMDYTFDACTNMFTQGQKTRMLSALLGPRASLISSDRCSPTTSMPITDFTAAGTAICAGNNIYFNNTSSFATSYNWTFAGGTPSTSTASNPTIVYNIPGTYTVTLTAFNAFGSDAQTYTNFVTVSTCAPALCQTISNVEPTSLSFFNFFGTLGFISGHNAFGDKAKADYFNYTNAPTSLYSLRIFFHKAQSTSSAAFIKYSVWDNDGLGGTPGTLLGSKNVLIDNINDSLFSGFYRYTTTFASPIAINGPFYAGVQLLYPSTSGSDSISILSSADGVLTSAGATAWEQNNLGNWVNMASSISINIAHHIYPKIGNLPNSNFSFPTGTFCIGEPISITNTSTFASTYNWTSGGGSPSSSAAINPTFLYSSAGTKSVSLVATNGCGSDIQTYSTSIGSNPIASISATSAYFCSGISSITLTANGAGLGGSYLWTAPGFSSTASSIICTPSSPLNYTVTATNSAGCSANATIVLTINNPTVALISSNDSVCLGQSCSLFSTGTAGTLTWSPSSLITPASPTSAFEVIATPTTSTTFTLSTLVGVCGASQTITIFVAPPPTINITSNQNPSCPSIAVDLTATPITTGSYSWSNGATANQTNVAPTATSSYDVEWNDALCSVTATFEQLVYDAATVPIVTYDNAQLSTAATGSYQWFINATPIAGATSSIYIPTTIGDYSLQIIDSSGCVASSAVITISNLVGMQTVNSPFSIHPNPFLNSITINTNTNETNYMQLYDAIGQLIMSKDIIANTSINTTSLSSGIYYLVLKDMRGAVQLINPIIKK